MRKNIAAVLLLGFTALAAFGASPAPVLQVPGAAAKPISPESLLGSDRRDVRLEDGPGDITVYHGLSLLEVLEKNGLDSKTMGAQRKLAATIVLATARDGYTVAFSAGEILMHRADPRVFLVAETAAGPLPEDKGPVRLVVYGDRPRSAYALAKIEVQQLAENARKP